MYFYDAVGTKLRKTVSGITTDYSGNYVYESGVLQFFNTAEGYVEPVSAGSTTFMYVYQYKNHLGNIRLSYADADGGIGILPPKGSTEEEQIVNNLTNKCAKEIFTELENGLWKDHPLKPEVQIPKENIELNFSQSILKLFNDSKTFNYVISNGNLLNCFVLK